MDPISVAGLGLELLGLSNSTINWIKKVAGKKLRIVPSEILSTTKHWLSTYIVVQNKSEDPIFDIQIICWLDLGQEVKIKPKHVMQKQDIGEYHEIDTAFYLLSGNVEGRPIKLLELSRIMPKESFEIEVQIHGKGKVQFIPTRYNEDKPKIIRKIDNNGIAIPFSPPFNMQLEGTSFWLNVKSNKPD